MRPGKIRGNEHARAARGMEHSSWAGAVKGIVSNLLGREDVRGRVGSPAGTESECKPETQR